MSSKRRVVVVDDSPILREALRELLEAEGDIEVVAEASDGEGAPGVVEKHMPDLVTMDIEMPGAGGLTAIEQIMARCPRPILVVTGLPFGPEGTLVFEAVRRGALDVAAKPSADEPEAGNRLRTQVRRLAGLPVVRHVLGLRPAGLPRGEAEPVLNRSRGGDAEDAGPPKVVGIAASAGGPAALAAVLSRLPAGFPACVAVVQHLPPGFAEPFSQFLATNTPLRVCVVKGRTAAAPGCVLIATDSRHLVAVSRETFVASDEPPVGGHRPSATVLFQSLAKVFGNLAAGVVLSGIGDDGAAGLAEMRRQGALTIAQDEKTCAVYGMPAAAVEAKAASRVLALDLVAPALVRAVSSEG